MGTHIRVPIWMHMCCIWYGQYGPMAVKRSETEWVEVTFASARFFADSLAAFFQTLIPLSDSLLAGNPATAGAGQRRTWWFNMISPSSSNFKIFQYTKYVNTFQYEFQYISPVQLCVSSTLYRPQGREFQGSGLDSICELHGPNRDWMEQKPTHRQCRQCIDIFLGAAAAHCTHLSGRVMY